jgi:hypothetical protein
MRVSGVVLFGAMMAELFIQLRCNIEDDPRIRGLAERLRCHPSIIVGACCHLWGLEVHYGHTGRVPGITKTLLDKRYKKGVADGLEAIGWAVWEQGGGVTLPRIREKQPDVREKLDAAAARSRDYRARVKNGDRGPESPKRDASVRARYAHVQKTCAHSALSDEDEDEEEEEEVNTKPPLPPAPQAVEQHAATPLAVATPRPAGNKGKPVDVAIPRELDSPEFRAAWDAWLQHRREARKPATPTAQRQTLAKLAAMGQVRAISALEHSTANGWTGVFEPVAASLPFSAYTQGGSRTHDAAAARRAAKAASEYPEPKRGLPMG